MMLKRNDLSNKSITKTKNVKMDKLKKKELKEMREILKNLSKYVRGCYDSNNYNNRYISLQKIRRLLSFQYLTPEIIEIVINTSIIPQLLHILHFNSTPLLQFESLWILTNIACGNTKQTRILVKYNIIPSLKRVLKSKNTNNEIKSQAMWCLGNIVGDSPFCRNILFVKYNMFYDVIVPIFTSNTSNSSDILYIDNKDIHKLNLLRESSWTLSNFCRKASKKVFFENRVAIINLFNFLLTTNDFKILNDVCWAINYFVENRNDKRCKLIIDEIIKNGIMLQMINLLIIQSENDDDDEKEKENVCFAALRIMSYIVSIEKYDTNEWTIKLIKLGIFKKFQLILKHKSNYKRKRREICFLISNMVANNIEYDVIINDLTDNNLFIPIMKMFKVSTFPIRKEAAYIIINIISNCDTLKKVDNIYKSSSIIPRLFELFRYNDNPSMSNKFAVAILESIQHLLELGEKYNNYKHLYHALKCSGIDALESMQHYQKQHGDKDDYISILQQKLIELIKLIRYQQTKQLLLVQCCSNKCNKTKYVNGYEISSINDDNESSIDSSTMSSESSYSRIKKHKFYRCKSCNSSVYCSKRCQKWHWKNGHKLQCKILS